jgi:hypothetical protein
VNQDHKRFFAQDHKLLDTGLIQVVLFVYAREYLLRHGETIFHKTVNITWILCLDLADIEAQSRSMFYFGPLIYNCI